MRTKRLAVRVSDVVERELFQKVTLWVGQFLSVSVCVLGVNVKQRIVRTVKHNT